MTLLRRAGHPPELGPAGQPRLRRKRLFKFGLGVLVLVAMVSVGLRIAAPHLISNAVVLTAIETSMAQWAGHPVTINDVSDLRFWPRPEVTLTGITISRNVDGRDEPFIEIDNLSAEFSLVSALKGKPDFNDFRFTRPKIRIERDLDGRLDWSGKGLLNEAVRAALAGRSQPAQGDGAGDTEVGSIEINDGQVTIFDAQSGATLIASAVNGRIDWPRLSAPLSGQADFRVNDRSMSLSLQTPTPLLLIGGSASEVDLSATLPGMRGQIKGMLDLKQGSVDQSAIDIRITDVAQAANALGMRLAGTERWQTASLTAQVAHADSELRFDNLAFDINGSSGDGILTVKKREGMRPLVSGTVAVDSLNLDDFLQAMSIELGDHANVRLPSLTRWVDVDMRLSASKARFASFELTDLGASLTGGRDSLKLVIGDTQFLGGTLSARVAGSGEGFAQGAEIAVMMDRVDLGALMTTVAPANLTLDGLGSLTFNAKLVGPGWRSNIEAMSGELDIRADGGAIVGVNADGLRRLSRDNAYFQLRAAGAGEFDYRTLDMALRFSEGSAEVEKAVVVGETETLSLTGIIPYSRQALALTGELSTGSAEPDETAPLRFFIGGAWQDPVISPIPPVPATGQ